MEKFLEKIDFVSKDAELYINENKTFKNSIGGFFSALSIIVNTIIIINTLFNFINENHHILNQSEIIDDNPTFNFTNFPILFSIRDNDGNYINEVNRFFKISSRKYEIQYLSNNTKQQKMVSSREINIKKCKDLRNNFSYMYFLDDFFSKDIFLDTKYCLDLSEENILKGIKGNFENNTYISIGIERCLNSSEINNCFSSEIIDYTFEINFIDYLNMGKKYLFSDKFSLLQNNKKSKSYQVSNIESISNSFFILGKNFIEKFYKIKETNTDIYFNPNNNNNENNLLEIFFTMSKNKINYKMTILNMQFYLSYMYILIKFVHFLIKFFSNQLNKFYYFIFICNKINVFEHLESEDVIHRDIEKINPLKVNVNNSKQNSNSVFKLNFTNKKQRKIFDSNSNSNNKDRIVNIESANNSNKNIIEIPEEEKIQEIKIKSCRLNNEFSDEKFNLSSKALFPHINENEKIKKKDNFNFEIKNNDKRKSKFNSIIKNSNQNHDESKFDNQNHNESKLNLGTLLTWKKKYYSLKFNLSDKFYSIFSCISKTKNFDIIDLTIKYIKKKMSIDEIIKKLIEVDKIKFLLMKKDSLKNLYTLDGPNIFFQQNQLNNKSKISDLYLLKLSNFWKECEFEKI